MDFLAQEYVNQLWLEVGMLPQLGELTTSLYISHYAQDGRSWETV